MEIGGAAARRFFYKRKAARRKFRRAAGASAIAWGLLAYPGVLHHSFVNQYEASVGWQGGAQGDDGSIILNDCWLLDLLGWSLPHGRDLRAAKFVLLAEATAEGVRCPPLAVAVGESDVDALVVLDRQADHIALFVKDRLDVVLGLRATLRAPELKRAAEVKYHGTGPCILDVLVSQT